ncbi:MAG: MBL fold metallo-hydrolase [Actinomycetota bacterium]|nr:MBL fold metallo-hydrolase [Actinomycetota bacterium]
MFGKLDSTSGYRRRNLPMLKATWIVQRDRTPVVAMTLELRTLGHATLLVLEDGIPLVATDPWLIGSTYWRSWWLEKYPSPEEIDLVRESKHLYITHSHPDHFHWPTLRHLGPRPVLHPEFPGYKVPAFLDQHGYQSRVLDPGRWYAINDRVRIASNPTPVDDSILVIDTPRATIVNLNDANPRLALLRRLRSRLCSDDKPIILLKSYSPASIAVSMYRDGKREPMKSKQNYAQVACRLAEAIGAEYYVPFASQAFFNRSDSRWANEYKVTFEDLSQHWEAHNVKLCEPFITMDLETLEHTSAYSLQERSLDETRLAKVVAREAEEGSFLLPDDFDLKLKAYLDEIYFLRSIFRRGIGWRLSSSGSERFYNTKTRAIEHTIPPNPDFTITLPDKVLDEALTNNVLTDLGITMFTRVDTYTDPRLAYGAFSLMGLHDYGHFDSPRQLAAFFKFYLPHLVPEIFGRRSATAPENVISVA